MIQKFSVLSGLVLSASCMVLHQPLFPVAHDFYYDANPNYNYAYEVNNAHTGDFKSKQESRRGGIVVGQYSLLQPDGVQRTVEYTADDHSGFQATVNNQGRKTSEQAENVNNDTTERNPNIAGTLEYSGNTGAVQAYQLYPTPVTSQSTSTATSSLPVSTSFVQTISHNPVPIFRNNHYLLN